MVMKMLEWILMGGAIVVLVICFALYCHFFYKTSLIRQFSLRYDFTMLLKKELGDDYRVNVVWVKFLPEKSRYDVLATVIGNKYYQLRRIFYFDEEKKVITDFPVEQS